jgi:ribosomal protein L11 methyltransferase
VHRYAPRVPVVELEVDAADAELAADALWQAGPSAVSEVAIGPRRVRLLADVADAALVPLRWSPRVIEPDSAAHLDAWRAWATPVRVGRRLLLQPAWITLAAPDPDVVAVRLDPGRTFGSGSHASTRLVVEVLEDELAAGDAVLDVGCGSGVLSVTACLLGARSALAVDIEPEAVTVTGHNARANGVASRVHAVTTPIHEVEGAFDIVVANIGARVLVELSDPIRSRAAPGGRVVLAGLLDHQVEEVVAAYSGCEEIGRRSLDGWSVSLLRC